MNKPLEIRGSLLARNTLLNFIGQAVPLLVGVVTIPFIVRGLGTERFGLLSLTWVILGYFAIFDLGLGSATTKFVAESLGKGKEEEIPSIVWTAVTVQVIFGALGGLVLAMVIPFLVEHVLNIPSELIGEAKTTFYLLAFSVPVVLVSSSFGGVLEASQRFDLVNAVGIPARIATFLLPLVGLLIGFGLPGIVVLILLARFGALASVVILSFRLYPGLKRYSGSLSLFPRLFSFGGWVTVSSIVSPILVYFERFLIASLLSVAAVAYYTPPHLLVSSLRIIPGSLTMPLFPAFSALEGNKERQRLEMLFARSVKYTLLIMAPMVLSIVLFAEEILRIWLGNEFAVQSTKVLQILALGVLSNTLAGIPGALIWGIGRPDITVKFQLVEVFIYIGVAWFLVSQGGIVGAALAWSFRVTLDALFQFIFAFRLCSFSPQLFATNRLNQGILVVLVLSVGTYGLNSIDFVPTIVQAILLCILLGVFFWIVWRKVIDDSERQLFRRMVWVWWMRR